MIFFDPASDKALIHASVRDHEELSNVADQVEHEVIEAYKQRPGIPIRVRSGRENLNKTPRAIEVRLEGYNVDNPEDSDDGLKEQLKRTIADVTSFMLRNYDNEQGVQQVRQGQRSVMYGNAQGGGTSITWRSFPPGWNVRLKNYDNRVANYAI